MVLGDAGRGIGEETQGREGSRGSLWDQASCYCERLKLNSTRKSLEAMWINPLRVIPPEGPGSWGSYSLTPAHHCWGAALKGTKSLALGPAAQVAKELQVKRKSSGPTMRCWQLGFGPVHPEGERRGVGRADSHLL